MLQLCLEGNVCIYGESLAGSALQYGNYLSDLGEWRGTGFKSERGNVQMKGIYMSGMDLAFPGLPFGWEQWVGFEFQLGHFSELTIYGLCSHRKVVSSSLIPGLCLQQSWGFAPRFPQLPVETIRSQRIQSKVSPWCLFLSVLLHFKLDCRETHLGHKDTWMKTKQQWLSFPVSVLS